MKKTFSAKPKDVVREWYLLDASKLPVGRIATTAASILIGKHKPSITSHIDCGDFVVIINAEKLVVTGEKLTDKLHYRYSGFPGGLKKRSLKTQLELSPEVILTKAVSGMIPTNKLKDGRLKRLKIYTGSEHKHQAQNVKLYGDK
jgi:large subunit ribosomal protein L13